MKKLLNAFWIGLTVFASCTEMRFAEAAPGTPEAPASSATAPAPIDVSAIKKSFVWLSHPTYGYIALVPTIDDDYMFYSLDGKVFYRQRLQNRSWQGETQWSAGFWSPRAAVGFAQGGRIEREPNGSISLLCGKATEPWHLMSPAEGAKLAETARFLPPLWTRQAHFLARDDRGVYVYVDRMQNAFGGKGHRIFRGPKGGMKELKMTNIVSDSMGEIYATKGGDLRLVSGTGKATWVAKKKPTELTIVPVEDNASVIYSELGIYPGNLGTPCDAIAVTR